MISVTDLQGVTLLGKVQNILFKNILLHRTSSVPASESTQFFN